MSSDINWALWLLTMVPLIFSAGPGNIMVATSGARSGVRGSLSFICGLDLTYFALAVAVGLGLGDLLQSYPHFATYLRFFGIGYIVYLASRFLRASMIEVFEGTMSFGLKEGVFVQVTNGKGMIMLIMMFSEFAQSGSTQQVLLLSAALVALNLVSHLLWASVGGAIKFVMGQNLLLLRTQNVAFAAMLFGVAMWLTAH